jgi:hypothetical protein
LFFILLFRRRRLVEIFIALRLVSLGCEVSNLELLNHAVHFMNQVSMFCYTSIDNVQQFVVFEPVEC